MPNAGVDCVTCGACTCLRYTPSHSPTQVERYSEEEYSLETVLREATNTLQFEVYIKLFRFFDEDLRSVPPHNLCECELLKQYQLISSGGETG